MIAIRFDGPPGPDPGRFVEVERDGASISFGEWKQDGEFWLLEMKEVDVVVKRLQDAAKAIESLDIDALGHVPSTPLEQGWPIREELLSNIFAALAPFIES
jgi:hypothetical protein